MLLQRQPSRATIPLGMVCLFLSALFWGGCTSAHYRKQADQDAYRIIQDVENGIFGHTNAFSIETAYSGRDAENILPEEILEDRLSGQLRMLTLREALSLGAQQSRRYQTEKERLYLTALTLTGARYEFGPQFFGRVTPQFERLPGGDTRGSIASSLGLNQMLKTGGSVGISLANELLRYYTGDPRESAVTVVSAELMQPLLRGFGKNNQAVESLTQAERNVIYAVRSYSFFQNQFAIDVVNTYFDLLARKNFIYNNYSNYLSQVQSTKRLEARSIDRESISAVDLARQSELNSRNSYINSIADYFNRLDQFKILLSIPLNERILLDDTELEKLQEIGLIQAELDSNAAFRLATERQLEILNDIDQYEDAKRKIAVAANQLRMGANFFADASLESQGPTDYTKFDIDDVRYSFGIQLDLPLDRLRERNDYRATLISFEAELRDLALALDTLKDDIDRGLRTLEQRRQNYITDQNALELANRRVMSNELLLQAGRAEVRDLVEAQNDQIRAQNAVTDSLVSYQETRLQLLQNLGLLETQSEHFWFKSHLDNATDIAATANTFRELPRDSLPDPAQIFSN